MDLRDLRYFAAIAEEGNLVRAAEKMFRTQPALTKSVHRLEQSLNTRLFERAGRGMVLTEAGKLLLARSKQLSILVSDATREIEEFSEGVAGHIRVGCIPTLAEHVLPQVCEELLANHPKVTIRLMVGMNDAQVAALKDGTVDIAIGPNVTADDMLTSEKLMKDEVVVLAGSRHPIFQRTPSMKALLDYQWVLPSTSVASRQWLDSAFDRHRLPRPAVQISSNVLNMILPLIEKTGLLGFASRVNLQSGRAKLREVALRETTMHRQIAVTYRTDGYLSPACQKLLAILRQRAPRGFNE